MEIIEVIGVPYFKKGNGIHIKKKNRGKFTEYCEGEVTQKCIDKAKKSKNPTLRKRATFAQNARKWKHQKGGSLYSAGNVVNTLYENNDVHEKLGTPWHKYDFTQSEEWANAHGYFPDERGHRDDRVKKETHPTHPSRGSWKGNYQFHLTDKGIEDPNHTIFGMADGGQDPQATLYYKNGIVLPEITVTPTENYIHNSYDNIKLSSRAQKHQQGGFIKKFQEPAGPITHDQVIPSQFIYSGPTSTPGTITTTPTRWERTKQRAGMIINGIKDIARFDMPSSEEITLDLIGNDDPKNLNKKVGIIGMINETPRIVGGVEMIKKGLGLPYNQDIIDNKNAQLTDTLPESIRQYIPQSTTDVLNFKEDGYFNRLISKNSIDSYQLGGKTKFHQNWLNQRIPILAKNAKISEEEAQKLANKQVQDLKNTPEYMYDSPQYYRELSIQDQYDAENAFDNGAHALYDTEGKFIVYQDPYLKNFAKTHERTHAMNPVEQELAITKYKNEKRKIFANPKQKYDRYLDSSTEVYARLMDAREKYKLDPKKSYNKDDIQHIREQIKKDWGIDETHIFNRYDDDYILHLLNNIAYNDPNTNSDVHYT